MYNLCAAICSQVSFNEVWEESLGDAQTCARESP